jgi:hypothetical protein
MLQERLCKILEETLHFPALSSSDRESMEEKLKQYTALLHASQPELSSSTVLSTEKGQAIGTMSGGTINNIYAGLPEEYQKRLTCWFDQWMNELGLDAQASTTHSELAATLVETDALKQRDLSQFQGITDIICAIRPDELSAFYAVLDTIIILPKIHWLDVAHLVQIVQRHSFSDRVCTRAYILAHPMGSNPTDTAPSRMIYHLAQLSYTDESLHPLCTFVHYIDEQQEQGYLQQWLEQVKNQRGVLPQIVGGQQECLTEAYIVVAIQVTDETKPGHKRERSSGSNSLWSEETSLLGQLILKDLDTLFSVDVWVCDDNGTLLWSQPGDRDETYPGDEVLVQIRNKIQQAIQFISSCSNRPPDIFVEFELERKWLLCEMEHIPLEDISPEDFEDGIVPTSLGSNYAVSVRMHRVPTHTDQLQRKWATWKGQACVLDSCTIAPIIQPEYSTRKHLLTLFKDAYAALMTFVSHDLSVYRRIFYYASERGMPLVLCPRPGVVESGEPLAEALRQMLQTQNIEAIRTIVKQKRFEALCHKEHIGRHLILFWNDPRRHPNPREYTRLTYEQR